MISISKMAAVVLTAVGCLSMSHISMAARTITVSNNTKNAALHVYLGFNGQSYGCYSQQYFSQFCNFNTGNAYVCQLSVQKGTPKVISFNKSCQVSVAFTSERMPWGACPTSLAEFTLNGNVGGKVQDTLDVSLVNGINKKINVSSSTHPSLINMTSASSPYNTILGVYPPGCDGCAVSISPPAWPNCPGKQPASNCQKGTQFNPNPGCQITRMPSSSTDSYTVSFIEKT